MVVTIGAVFPANNFPPAKRAERSANGAQLRENILDCDDESTLMNAQPKEKESRRTGSETANGSAPAQHHNT